MPSQDAVATYDVWMTKRERIKNSDGLDGTSSDTAWHQYGPAALLFAGLMGVAAIAACVGWMDGRDPLHEWFAAFGSILAGVSTAAALAVAWATYRRAQADKRERENLEKLAAARMVAVKVDTVWLERGPRYLELIPGIDPRIGNRVPCERAKPHQGACVTVSDPHDVVVEYEVRNDSPLPIRNVRVVLPLVAKMDGGAWWRERRVGNPDMQYPASHHTVIFPQSSMKDIHVLKDVGGTPRNEELAEVCVEFEDVWGHRWHSCENGLEAVEVGPNASEAKCVSEPDEPPLEDRPESEKSSFAQRHPMLQSWWVSKRKISNVEVGLWVACAVLAIIATVAIILWLNSYEPMATEFVPLVQSIASIATVLSLVVALTAYGIGAKTKRDAAEALQKSYAQMVGVAGTSERFAVLEPNGQDAERCPTEALLEAPDQPVCSHSRGHDAKLEVSVQNNSPYPIHKVFVLVPGSDVWERMHETTATPPKRVGFGTVLAGKTMTVKTAAKGLVSGPGDGAVSSFKVDFVDVSGQRWLSSSEGAVSYEEASA